MASESAVSTLPLPRRAGAFTFAAIFAIESLVRSLNSTVISLQAYDILGASQRVSVLALAVSLGVLVTTLLLPFVLGEMRRRWAYSFGAALMLAAAVALASHSLWGQALGMYLRNIAAAIFHITLSLYILDNIRRQDLAHAEPIRLSLSTFSWMIGPPLGVWLYLHHGAWGPQIAVSASLVLLLVVFWTIRLSDRGQVLPPGNLRKFNPLANVRRFAVQPRLRLAWLIAFGRSCFWSTFFIYGPILIVEGGLDKATAGLVIAASQALLLAAYLSGSLARRYGVRTVIAGGFVLCAVSSFGAGLAGVSNPWAAIALLLAASLAASALDGVGGIPFLRSVRPFERQRMTPVYRTFIDFSELVPALVFAVALMWFDVGAVFVFLAGGLLIIAYYAWRFLPQSM